ncbi:hypothetical protein NY2A_B218R [Paramecium bursaria Chlorella virus NY2A]|uniref:Uncharacterized protein B218R n=2 Tax=Chlorovirus TaxID=181083 RepID=A7IW93_PBCVN|nr:hypothetical protein NY2A_B218R [Paramecium bursaria Chlorella virus NY2A]YP_009665295.1 hypothetical protein FK949_gp085 [Paramecium bursaria Chlorella virus NYs1]ABT14617.1 hypothetical protein NY2A_B218R [Paramecium bursaria Chlorella virus NY2A]AGE54154.1 hypothetical protein PBCVIL52s1_240R [Paramecium bursaria Chlorella virus IL-5-2s1]AGE58650.1 hypothetical protein PBCVNYs1_229R [Paramecium bursaria Chlorella virus NYs1]
MDPDEFARFWKQDLPFEEKAKLYYEKVPHVVDDKGGYRSILTGEYRKDTLRYFKDDGTFEIFDDYTIDTNRVIARKDNRRDPTPYNLGEYLNIVVRKNSERYNRSLARAMLSTFLGPPPDVTFTADHIESEHKLDDDLSNLRWLDQSGQANNRNHSETRRSARLIVNDLFPEDELTAKEWTKLLTKPDGTKYHEINFRIWAHTRENGFSYKTYDDLDDEEWKIVGDPDKNHVEVSNKNRVKDVTFSESGHKEEHVRTSEQLNLTSGYPCKKIDGVRHLLHVLVFQLWYPELWKNKKENEMVLHDKDNKLDFRPENLYLGTDSKNGIDAHDNGKRDGTKTARQPCVAYKDDEVIEEFKSMHDATKYLMEHFEDLKFEAARSGIRNNIDKNKEYKGFAWKSI